MLHVHITALTAIAVISVWLGQFKCRQIALLVGYELIDALHLRRVYKGTLHTDGLTTVQIEHVSSAHQLLGTRTVQNGS